MWSFVCWTKSSPHHFTITHRQVDISKLPVQKRRKCWTAVSVDEVISRPTKFASTQETQNNNKGGAHKFQFCMCYDRYFVLLLVEHFCVCLFVIFRLVGAENMPFSEQGCKINLHKSVTCVLKKGWVLCLHVHVFVFDGEWVENREKGLASPVTIHSTHED